MAYITGLTKDKQEWTPQFIVSIDEELCIGCGR
jgi:Fe-S-cluster-containing dehydrogenase component